jgi:hypothetical protein
VSYRYRDSDTGRFASKATYNRSVSHGGTRFEREVVGSRGETMPEAEEVDYGYGFDDDFIDEGFEADEEAEY